MTAGQSDLRIDGPSRRQFTSEADQCLALHLASVLLLELVIAVLLLQRDRILVKDLELEHCLRYSCN